MIRRLTQWHEDERLLAVTQTARGQLAVCLAGVGLLLWHRTTLLMPAAFAAIVLMPTHRRRLLALAGGGMLLERVLERYDTTIRETLLTPRTLEPVPWPSVAGQVAVGILGIFVISLVVRRFDRFPSMVKRIPLIALHVLTWITLALSTLPSLGFLVLVNTLAWRNSYLLTLASRGKLAGTTFKDYLFYLAPVCGGTSPPHGKGLDYLARHEALDAEAIARSQLSGLKLLALSILWTAALSLIDATIFGDAGGWSSVWVGAWSLDLPHVSTMVRTASVPSVPAAWTSMYFELVRATLQLAATGHLIVGCLRLVGFNVFRNTYKPLMAESVVEFWNRYYFYFKELLVDFFFYPTFLRCRWAPPRARLLLAVFAAAFLGNMYFHLLSDPDPLLALDLPTVGATWGPRLVYCFLLSVGIWVSMLRQQQRRRTSTPSGGFERFRRIAGVWTFYAVIGIWNIRSTSIGFAERFDFMAAICGLQ